MDTACLHPLVLPKPEYDMKKPISSIVKIYGLLLLPSPMGIGCNPPKPLDYYGNPPAPTEPIETEDTAESEDTAEPGDSGEGEDESDSASTEE